MKASPLVTVIMPIRNEGRFIAHSLGAVLAQTYPATRLEVLVADGMSTDRTREIVKSSQSRHANLRLIDNPGQIVATGLNAALAEARGEIIVRVDGHTIVEPDYVRMCVETLRHSKASTVGGRMDAVGTTGFGRAVARATGSPFGVGGARFHYSDRTEWVDTVYLGAWRREVFEQVGLFDDELVRNQDDEFNYRLRARGGKILLNPAIKSLYYNRSTAASLWRQYYQYGYWKVRVMQKHPRQMQPRQFVPFLFVLSLMTLVAAAPFSKRGLWALGLEVGLYALANLAASVFTARKGNWHLLPRLPLTFAVLHLSYGLGFVAGLIKFRKRWAASADQPTPYLLSAIVNARSHNDL